jgi:hypothetical protein
LAIIGFCPGAYVDLGNVLAKVPGAHVSAASRMLPAAMTDTVDERAGELEVPNLGIVRFFFRRMTAKKGKSRHTFWCADRAVVVAPEQRPQAHQGGLKGDRGEAMKEGA